MPGINRWHSSLDMTFALGICFCGSFSRLRSRLTRSYILKTRGIMLRIKRPYVGIKQGIGCTRCGAIRIMIFRSYADSCIRLKSKCCMYLRPPWIVFWLLEEFLDPKSALSINATDSPLDAASQ